MGAHSLYKKKLLQFFQFKIKKVRRISMKKMCSLKRITAGLVLMLFSCSTLGTFCVSANNYHDTKYVGSVSGNGTRWTTSARKKTDDTYSYQYCASTTRRYQSWVYGSYKSNISSELKNLHNGTIKKDLRNPKTRKLTPTYWFSSGTSRYMINYVKENNLPYAGMMFMTGDNGGGYATVWWSPDSI